MREDHALDEFARLTHGNVKPGPTIFDRIEPATKGIQRKREAEEVKGYKSNQELIDDIMLLGSLYRKNYILWNSDRDSDLRVFSYLTSVSSLNGFLEDGGGTGDRKVAMGRITRRIYVLERKIDEHASVSKARLPIPELFSELGLTDVEKQIVYLLMFVTNYVESGVTVQDVVNILRSLGRTMEDTLSALSTDSKLIDGGILEVRSNEFIDDHKDPLKRHVMLTQKAINIMFLGRDGDATEKVKVMGPRFGLDRIVLPYSMLETLYMLCAQEQHRKTLYSDWGLDQVIGDDHKGLKLLFYGPPGTGKTATAEAMAHELGRPLLVADYPSIVDAYVGETIKNIKKLFKAASDSGAVLLLDEADAIVSRRRVVSTPVDSELNRDVNIILQELERFEGVAILTTNFSENLDPALKRRVHFVFEFQNPDERERERLWKIFLPEKMPLDDGVHIEILSKKFELTGAQIKNTVINAARTSIHRISRGIGPKAVTMADLEKAVENLPEGKTDTVRKGSRKMKVDGYL